MELSEAKSIIKEFISERFEEDDIELEITEDMPLIGGESALDSMKLIELCLFLEDKASDIGFEFDWTSDTAMSKSRSMFRTINDLAGEFYNQYMCQK